MKKVTNLLKSQLGITNIEQVSPHLIVIGDAQGTILIYNISEFRLIKVIHKAHKNFINMNSINKIKKYQFISCSFDQAIFYWKINEKNSEISQKFLFSSN